MINHQIYCWCVHIMKLLVISSAHQWFKALIIWEIHVWIRFVFEIKENSVICCKWWMFRWKCFIGIGIYTRRTASTWYSWTTTSSIQNTRRTTRIMQDLIKSISRRLEQVFVSNRFTGKWLLILLFFMESLILDLIHFQDRNERLFFRLVAENIEAVSSIYIVALHTN